MEPGKRSPAGDYAGAGGVHETTETIQQMPRGSARPPNAGKGRPKGVPNKHTITVKDMLRTALEKAGGAEYLQMQATLNPGPFMALIGKLIPSEISAKLTGEDGGPVRIEVVTGLPPADSSKGKE